MYISPPATVNMVHVTEELGCRVLYIASLRPKSEPQVLCTNLRNKFRLTLKHRPIVQKGHGGTNRKAPESARYDFPFRSNSHRN